MREFMKNQHRKCKIISYSVQNKKVFLIKPKQLLEARNALRRVRAIKHKNNDRRRLNQRRMISTTAEALWKRTPPGMQSPPEPSAPATECRNNVTNKGSRKVEIPNIEFHEHRVSRTSKLFYQVLKKDFAACN